MPRRNPRWKDVAPLPSKKEVKEIRRKLKDLEMAPDPWFVDDFYEDSPMTGRDVSDGSAGD